MTSIGRDSLLNLLLKNATLASFYFLAAKFGLALAIVHPSAAAMWPPTGIALAALLVFGYRVWPAVFTAAFIANITTNGSAATSLIIAGGNTLEALAGAFLVVRYASGCKAFDRPQSIFRYALVAGLGATLVSATIGVTSLCAGGYADWTNYSAIWVTWWLGDMGGNLIFAPVLILWLMGPRPHWRRERLAEALLLLLFFAAESTLVFRGVGATASSRPAILLSVPLLIWIAFRFGQRETVTAYLAASIVAMAATLNGHAPLVLQSPNESLLTLQVVIAIIGVMVMALAAAVAEHHRSESEVRRLNDELERRVLTRTIELYERSAMFEDANRKLLAETAERKRTEEEMHRTLMRLQALRSIEMAVVSSLDLPTILDVLLEKIERFFPYPTAATVRLLNAGTGELEPLACRNLDKEEWSNNGLKALMPFARSVIDSRFPQMLSNMRHDARTRRSNFYLKHGLISAAKFPLVANEEVLGILAVYTKHEHEFNEEEFDFLNSLSGQAAVAIHHSQLYAKIKRHTEELTLMNKAKNQFLGVMSHELRTPLNVVMGYSSLLKLKTYGEINPKQAEILDKVLLNANHQLVMIDRILEVTQIAAGATLVLLQEVDLKGLIDEFRETFAAREKDGVVLKWNIAPLPMVETDGDKLKHILQNLIDNAIKFTEEGEIVVSASYDHPREELSLIVADTGTGIAAENIPHLFEMFSQCDSSETRLHGGAGIGLYIVKNLTERLRGRVEVASKPGRGSTFTVTIPAKRKMKRMTA